MTESQGEELITLVGVLAAALDGALPVLLIGTLIVSAATFGALVVMLVRG